MPKLLPVLACIALFPASALPCTDEFGKLADTDFATKLKEDSRRLAGELAGIGTITKNPNGSSRFVYQADGFHLWGLSGLEHKVGPVVTIEEIATNGRYTVSVQYNAEPSCIQVSPGAASPLSCYASAYVSPWTGKVYADFLECRDTRPKRTARK